MNANCCDVVNQSCAVRHVLRGHSNRRRTSNENKCQTNENDWCRPLFLHFQRPTTCFIPANFHKKLYFSNDFHLMPKWIFGCRSPTFIWLLLQCFPKRMSFPTVECWSCFAFGQCHSLPSFRHLVKLIFGSHSVTGTEHTANGTSIN